VIALKRHEDQKREAQGTEADDRSGIPAAAVDKILKILAFMENMESEDELRALPAWKPHQLSGDRKGTWALHVTKNWRMTFQIDRQGIEIIDLDYEDYH
jgi:proteic killer suppression protein